MEISEELIGDLEMALLEEVSVLREAIKSGLDVSPLDIAIGYLSPEYAGGKELSHHHHSTALACLVGIALHWLACRQQEVVP